MATDVSAVLQSVIDRAKVRGISEDDISRVVAGQGDRLLEKFVDVMSNTARNPRESFPTAVNYDLSVEDAIAAGDYRAVNGSITSRTFSSVRHGQAELQINLIRFDRRMTSEEVLRELEKEDLRAVELPELLAFGATHPDVQRQFSVVGLGSVWHDRKGYRNVPCLYAASEGRYLDLHWWDDAWYSYSRFAVVPK